MCVSINDERGARNYVAELFRIGMPSYARNIVRSYQKSHNWLMDLDPDTGKPVVLTGEVSDASKQKYQTVMLLEVSAASGCGAGGACTVRLVQGGDSPAKRGDALRVYGHVARAFSVPGHPDIPEIEVDFTLKGDARDRK